MRCAMRSPRVRPRVDARYHNREMMRRPTIARVRGRSAEPDRDDWPLLRCRWTRRGRPRGEGGRPWGPSETSMKAEIIAIGSELVSGQALDTNSQWLSRGLAGLGIAVHFHTTLGDDPRRERRRVPDRDRAGRPRRDERRARADPGRPDPRGAGRGRGRAAGRGRRLARGDRGDVRPPQPRDGRAEPGPGPLPARGRAAAQPRRHRARASGCASARRDRRLPAGRARARCGSCSTSRSPRGSGRSGGGAG